MIFGVLYMMQEQGEAYVSAGQGRTVDKRELTYPYMPPFVGTEEEMAALAAYVAGLSAAEEAAAGGGGE